MSVKSQISQTPLNRARPHHRGVLFIEGLPKTTKEDFKATCKLKRITMRDAIITLMRRFILEAREDNTQ